MRGREAALPMHTAAQRGVNPAAKRPAASRTGATDRALTAALLLVTSSRTISYRPSTATYCVQHDDRIIVRTSVVGTMYSVYGTHNIYDEYACTYVQLYLVLGT